MAPGQIAVICFIPINKPPAKPTFHNFEVKLRLKALLTLKKSKILKKFSIINNNTIFAARFKIQLIDFK